jgi:hypothetical protein
MPFKPFPTDKPRKTATIAKQASVELHNVLSSNVLFKPFQLRDHSVSSITLQTTYDEIYIIGKEKALLRPHFEMSATTVTIPVLFAKVLGIEINTIKYWADFHKLQRDSKLRQVFRTFTIKKDMKGNQQYHYQFALENGTLKPEKLLQASWWTYKEISYSAQMALANAICRYVMKNNLLAQQGESVDDMRLYLFSQAMNIPQSIIKLLQQFDYSQDIPKVIVYNNGYQFARQDAALLLLVNELGFDVILYNPSGQNDLELYINSDKIDSHWLSEINFNEDFQEDNTSTFFNFLRRKI